MFKRWVLLDLDGTLIDTVPLLYKVYRAFLHRYGVKGSWAEFQQFNGPSTAEIVSALKKKYALPKDEKKLLSCYSRLIQKAYSAAKPKKGADGLLMSLERRAYNIALVTSTAEALAKPILKRLTWYDRFNSRTYGNEIKRSKPHPEIYLKALKKINVHAKNKNAVVLEDSNNGVLAARRAGLAVFRVSPKDDLQIFVEKIRRYFIQIIGCDVVAATRKLTLSTTRPSSQKEVIFCARRIREQGTSVSMDGHFIPYKQFRRLVRAKKSTAVGVSGIVYTKANKKIYFLLGKRSSSVATFKHRYELAPSGGINNQAQYGARIDFIKILKQEWSEETGMSVRQIKKITPLCLVRDEQGTYDIGCSIRIHAGVLKQPLRPNKEEYSELRFVEEARVEKMFLGRSKSFVPASGVLFEMFQSMRKG